MRNFILVILILIFSNCNDDNPYQGDCFVPNVGVSAVINMNLPEYFHLQNLGSYIYYQGGSKGILVMHNFDDSYHALERSCTYQSENACSKIFVDSISLLLRCGEYDANNEWQECCQSRFTYDGLVTQGPAACNLKRYQIFQSNNQLNISN